jgi:hypothetical protein
VIADFAGQNQHIRSSPPNEPECSLQFVHACSPRCADKPLIECAFGDNGRSQWIWWMKWIASSALLRHCRDRRFFQLNVQRRCLRCNPGQFPVAGAQAHLHAQADVGTEAACLAFVNGAAQKFGRLDIRVGSETDPLDPLICVTRGSAPREIRGGGAGPHLMGLGRRLLCRATLSLGRVGLRHGCQHWADWRALSSPAVFSLLLGLSGGYSAGWVVCAVPAVLVGVKMFRQGKPVQQRNAL